MNKLLPIFMIPILLFTVPVFAQEGETETEIQIQTGIDEFFDWIQDFGQAQTNSSTWFDQDKKDEINSVGDSAVTTGKIAFDLWFSFHKFIVDLVFAGSPVPFDKGIIILVSFVIGTILVFKIFWAFFKKIWKIVVIIIAIIAVILVSGIEFPSIS